ncbi:MAG: hypothetical protein ACXWL5_00735 [Candidatus Chromulinivorax sp.]
MMPTTNHLITTFKLQNDTTIDIYSEEELQSLSHYSYSNIVLYQNNKAYVLTTQYPPHLFLLHLQKLLQKSLSCNLKLDASITHDLGYLWNEWLNNNHASLLYITDKNNDTYWIGQLYELASNEYVSWIYNDEQCNIIFETTPAYPLGCIDQDNEIEVKNYMSWIQSYKPISKIIIPVYVAQQSIEQAQEILNIIDENSKILREQGKL